MKTVSRRTWQRRARKRLEHLFEESGFGPLPDLNDCAYPQLIELLLTKMATVSALMFALRSDPARIASMMRRERRRLAAVERVLEFNYQAPE